MRSNLELLPVINVKRRPRYISALKKSLPDISRPTKSRHYFDALNGRQIGRQFPDSRAFMAVPVSIDGKSILTLYYSTLQKEHKSKYNFYFNHLKDLHDLNIR